MQSHNSSEIDFTCPSVRMIRITVYNKHTEEIVFDNCRFSTSSSPSQHILRINGLLCDEMLNV
jgi:hypothetical protein